MDGSNKGFLRLLEQEIATTENELDEAQRKLMMLKRLRESYASGAARRNGAGERAASRQQLAKQATPRLSAAAEGPGADQAHPSTSARKGNSIRRPAAPQCAQRDAVARLRIPSARPQGLDPGGLIGPVAAHGPPTSTHASPLDGWGRRLPSGRAGDQEASSACRTGPFVLHPVRRPRHGRSRPEIGASQWSGGGVAQLVRAAES
jgi:hypothetical protein